MSELKEHLFCECDEFFREYRGQLSNENRPYYLKSEADKVIAELKAENESLLQQNHELCQALQVMYSKEEYDKQKYKRCLAMAKWCEAELFTYPPFGTESPKEKWCQKWRNRWLKLAEKFKEVQDD